MQLGRPAIEPPGQARRDWEIICDLSNRIGYRMDYETVEDVFNEFAGLTPSYSGITYERLSIAPVIWPCPDEQHPGTSVLFTESFPTATTLGKFVPAEFLPQKEMPDEDYPFILNTGRNLTHWHTGTMTRRAKALDELSPEPYIEIHPDDLSNLGASDGDILRVSSRRGELTAKARISSRPQRGSIFIPFHYKEAAANLLTIDELDPDGKIPEFKCCAVRIGIA